MSINSFREIQFPTDIAYGATGGPEFFTDIVVSSSGFEQRNMNWMQARCRYNLAPAINTKEQLDQLLAFFRLSQGRAMGFRFKDWIDYQLKRQQIAVADGKTSHFQLLRTYSYAGYQVVRKITKPVKNTVQVYCDNKIIAIDVDYTNGQIKFKQPPTKDMRILVDAEFDVPVRFDIDRLVTSIESYGVYSHQEIPLIELKI